MTDGKGAPAHETRGPATVGTWLALPRGGYYVRTSAGPIQIGIPPETIKDVMELKLDVPIAYVLPRTSSTGDAGCPWPSSSSLHITASSC